jgi:hypothetical protein
MSHRNGTAARSTLSIGSRGSSRRGENERFQEVFSNFRVESKEELQSSWEEDGRVRLDPSITHVLLGFEVMRLQDLEIMRTRDCEFMHSDLAKAQEKLAYFQENTDRLKKQLEEEKSSHRATRMQLEDTQKMLQESTASMRQTPLSTPEPSTPVQSNVMNEMVDKIRMLEASVKCLMAEMKEREKGSPQPPQHNQHIDEEDPRGNQVFLITESNEKDGDESENYDYVPSHSPFKDSKGGRKSEQKGSLLKMNPQLKKMVPTTIDLRRHSRSKTMFSETNLTEVPHRRNSRMVSEIESGFDTNRNTYSKESPEEKTPSHDNQSEINHPITFDRLGKNKIFSHQTMFLKSSIDCGQRKPGNSKGLGLGKDECSNSELGRLSSRCTSTRQIVNKVKPFNLTIENNSSRRPSYTAYSTLGNSKDVSDLKFAKYSNNNNIPDSRSQVRLDDLFAGGSDLRFNSLTKFDKGSSEMPKGNSSQSGFSKFMYKSTKDPRKRLGMASDKKYTHASCHLDLIK